MSHKQQRDFCRRLQKMYRNYFIDVDVLDVGSCDINGNNREWFSGDFTYTGVDPFDGPNVDIVGVTADVPGDFDVVISTEMLEHDETWEQSLRDMCAKLRPGGMLILTCAGRGRKEHGTKRFPKPGMANGDYYRNLDEEDIRPVLEDAASWYRLSFARNDQSCDTYVLGIAEGTLPKASQVRAEWEQVLREWK